MKNFNDLVFEPHSGGMGERATLEFDNGYSVSVVSGQMFYTSPNQPYEAAVMDDNGLCYDTPVTDDVIGHLTKSGVTDVMKQIQELPAV